MASQVGTDVGPSSAGWLALLVMLIDPSAVAAEAPLPRKPKGQRPT